MAKIVVGSPSLTQPLLLYPGLGPAMLDNIGGVRNKGESLRRRARSQWIMAARPSISGLHFQIILM
jgi:hypothetical protein